MEEKNRMEPSPEDKRNPDPGPDRDIRPQAEEKILLITPEMFWDLLMEQQEQM